MGWSFTASNWSGLTSGMRMGTWGSILWLPALVNTATPASASWDSVGPARSEGMPLNAILQFLAILEMSMVSILLSMVSSRYSWSLTFRTSPSLLPWDLSEA